LEVEEENNISINGEIAVVGSSEARFEMEKKSEIFD